MKNEIIYKRPSEICKIFSIGQSTLYKYAKNPDFPKPLRISKKITLWNVKEVEEFFKKLSLKGIK